MALPQSMPNGSSVIWSSSNPQIISVQGNVNSPVDETNVVLTATMTNGNTQRTYRFDVTVPKFCDFTTSALLGDTVQLNLEAANITDLKNKEFTIEYDTEDYEVTDLCMLTLGKETKRNQVMSPNITITENLPGKISFRVNRDIPSGKRLSGILNSIQLKSKKNNSKNVKFYVTNLG